VPDLVGWRMLGPTEALLLAALHLACPGPYGRRWIWALDGLLLLEWATSDPPTLKQRATEAQIADLWDAFLCYAHGLTQPRSLADPEASGYRAGQELRLLLSRAPWPDRLQVLREILWPREAFLRDRYTNDAAPLYRLQIRRWIDSASKSARRIRLGGRLR
jgi:hypothetical protein